NRLIELSLMRNSDKKNFWDHFYNYLGKLSDTELRMLENVFYDSLSIIHFIGLNQFHAENVRFKNLTIGKLLRLATVMMENWEEVIQIFPSNTKPISYLRPTANILRFFRDGLLASKANNPYYELLNDGLLILNESYLNQPNAWIDSLLSSKEVLKSGIVSSYDLLNDLYASKGGGLDDFSKTLKVIYESNGQKFDSYKNYLSMVAMRTVCDRNNCRENHHFDEVFKLLKKTVENDSELLRDFFNFLFGKNEESIIEFINRVFPDFRTKLDV
ncbi:MAG: hypothetical protein KDD50_15315, partial [Bdellovibrionales bacterium]|nr:hypothetical protein [Bdellovibrionales bacterium]